MDITKSQQQVPFSSIYLSCVDQFCDEHDKTGQVLAGNNGPHDEPETPLRNTSHWIIALSNAHRLSENERYRAKAEELALALCSSRFRPGSASYVARVGHGVDRCNGLIGQAWVLEALAEAGELTGNSQYRQVGVELVLRHKFSTRWSLWHSLDPDGRSLNIDNVFNHQLWFAAAASMVNGGEVAEVNNKIESFLDALEQNLELDPEGLVKHHINRIMNAPSVRLAGLVKHVRDGTIINRLSRMRRGRDDSKSSAAFKVGYQSFNAYGFALLKRQTSGHSFWGSDKLQRLVEALLTDQYRSSLRDNVFGFGYNPPGYEIPFALQELTDLPENQLEALTNAWISSQVEHSYDPVSRSMSRNAVDPVTQAARLYEVSRLSIDLLRKTRVLRNEAQHTALH